MIASWFVSDLTLPRPSRLANHHITAIGSSSHGKAASFVKAHLSNLQPAPTCHDSYESVFADPNVDIVYIATPHAQHASLCLAAISAGKHVLCEKAFALNAREASTVIAAARSRGVFVMEAMWLRFIPLVAKFQDLLHKEKIIGDVLRVFCDFGLNMPIKELPKESRLRDPALGAGSLLDIGIYSLTWGI
jgi:predicted dehydrogenase